mmetsp:Transcript_56530/g.120245  ORF Transcript_56530/g.120245 Transcript_56530/m.120245 type:complete len:513 (-) Transcript_56530:258-1796(-)
MKQRCSSRQSVRHIKFCLIQSNGWPTIEVVQRQSIVELVEVQISALVECRIPSSSSSSFSAGKIEILSRMSLPTPGLVALLAATLLTDRSSSSSSSTQPKMRPSTSADWISEVITDEVGILVSDMSGFTQTVRRHGILHFASIIARKRQLSLPILKKRGAVRTFTEGDDLIAVFKSVSEAALAAVEMQQSIKAYNSSLSDDRAAFTIKLGGVGVHCGSGIVIDKNGTISGEPFRGAYFIGENLCEGGNVLFSSSVKERVEGLIEFSAATFTKFDSDEMECFAVEGVVDLVPKEGLPAPDDGSHISPHLLPLARRHSPGADLERMDKEILANHLKRSCVLMFSLDLSSESDDDTEVLCRKFRCLEPIGQVLREHQGQGLEDLLWLFENPVDAVLGALAVQKLVRRSNQSGVDERSIEVTGYGIHCGEILQIEGTDVHWGDPVNTASKLGQDMAKGGTIVVTTQVKEECLKDSRFVNATWKEESCKMSGADFVYHIVTTPEDATPQGSPSCGSQ